MASYRKRGRVWCYRFVDAAGIQVERRGCSDRRETERLAAAAEAEAARVRAGYIDPKAPALMAHEARPLAEHLQDFESFLRAKGNTVSHCRESTGRASRVIEGSGARRISDLGPSRVQEALAGFRARGMAAETINHHIRSIKAFARWLWKDGRAREHLLAHLATSSPEADRRRVRRALTPDESRRLVRAAEQGDTVMGIPGRDRAAAYALALATGLRASELASLTPESFHLHLPEVVVEAAYSKNRRKAAQPLPTTLAAVLRDWLAPKPPGEPVLRLPDRTAEMLRHDLKAAGIEVTTAAGVLDFHALRNTYISEVVRSGATVKTCQELARHSTPTLTIGLYAKVDRDDLTRAVERLPDSTTTPSLGNASPPHLMEPLALYLPYGADGTGRDLAVCAPRAGADRNPADSAQVLNRLDPDASGRDLSQSTEGGTRTHTGVTPPDFESGASAIPPLRHAGRPRGAPGRGTS